MEILGLVDIPMWVILLIFVVISAYYYSVMPFSVWKVYGVEGPPPLPFFGNMIELNNPRSSVRECMKKWKKKYGGVFGIYFFRDPSLVVTDPEVMKEVLVKNFNNFADRHWICDGDITNEIVDKGMFFLTGDAWRRIRHISSPTFTSGKIKALVHHVNYTSDQLTQNFLKNANGKCVIDAKLFFGTYALDTMAGIAFSLKTDTQNDFESPFAQNAKALMNLKLVYKLTMLFAGFFPKAMSLLKPLGVGLFDRKVCKYLDNWVRTMIEERKSNYGKVKYTDFLEMLLNAESEDKGEFEGKKLSLDEIVGQCLMFIIAGYESTSIALQFICYEMARNPDSQDKLVAEIRDVVGDTENPTYDQIQNLKYTAAVIYEALRLYPAVTVFNRKAKEACTVGGKYSIPANTGIVIPAAAIGRDPEFFEDPDTFKPERFLEGNGFPNYSHVTNLGFGFGPRMCIGSRLAMMDAKLALVHLFRKVVIVDVSPKNVEIDDFSGLTTPKVPIMFAAKKRE